MKNIRNFNEFLNESNLNEGIIDDLAKAIVDEDHEQSALLRMKLKGSSFNNKDIDRALVPALKKLNDISLEAAERKEQEELENIKSNKLSYNQAIRLSELKDKYGSKKRKTAWNIRKYNKWIKDMSSNGGANNAYDMAQNAKHENGLLDFVRKSVVHGEESPLERIQWDIENLA